MKDNIINTIVFLVIAIGAMFFIKKCEGLNEKVYINSTDTLYIYRTESVFVDNIKVKFKQRTDTITEYDTTLVEKIKQSICDTIKPFSFVVDTIRPDFKDTLYCEIKFPELRGTFKYSKKDSTMVITKEIYKEKSFWQRLPEYGTSAILGLGLGYLIGR